MARNHHNLFIKILSAHHKRNRHDVESIIEMKTTCWRIHMTLSANHLILSRKRIKSFMRFFRSFLCLSPSLPLSFSHSNFVLFHFVVVSQRLARYRRSNWNRWVRHWNRNRRAHIKWVENFKIYFRIFATFSVRFCVMQQAFAGGCCRKLNGGCGASIH